MLWRLPLTPNSSFWPDSVGMRYITNCLVISNTERNLGALGIRFETGLPVVGVAIVKHRVGRQVKPNATLVEF